MPEENSFAFRLFPSHVALPYATAIRVADPTQATACMLFAAHRFLRLLCILNQRTLPGLRFDTLVGEVHNILNQEYRYLKDIVEAAALFLEPFLSGNPQATHSFEQEVEEALRAALSELGPAGALATVPKKYQGVLDLWMGPSWAGSVRYQLQIEASGTFWLPGEPKEPIFLGPSTNEEPAQPLLPVLGTEIFENPQGVFYDARGEMAGPGLGFTPELALGRLIAWHLPPGVEPLTLSRSLAHGGLRQVAAECLLANLDVRGEDFVEKAKAARAFMLEHALEAYATSLDRFVANLLEREEAVRRQAQDWEGVTKALLARVDFESGRDKVLVLQRLANLFAERFENLENAYVCLESALEQDPSDEGLLADLLELAKEAKKELEAGRKALELARLSSGATRTRLAKAAAELLASAGGGDREVKDALCIALEGEPEENLVNQAYELAVRLKDHAWLEALLRLRKRSQDISKRVEATLELAVLLHEGFGRTEEALGEYSEALALEPGNPQIIEHLLSLYIALERFAEARVLCEDLEARVFEPSARAFILHKHAEILRTYFPGEPEAEARVLEELIALRPKDKEVLERMAYLCQVLEDFQRFMLVKRALVRLDPERAALHLLDMGHAALEGLNDPVLAVSFYREAAGLDPQNPEPAERIKGLFETLGMWKELASELEEQAQRVEGTNRVELLLRLAKLCLEKLGQRERAKRALTAALEAGSKEKALEIARLLFRLHGEDGEIEAQEGALLAAARLLGEDEAAAELYAELGQLALFGPAHDVVAARAHFERAVAINPLHVQAVERLAGLLMQAGDYAPVVALVEPPLKKAGDQEVERRLRILAAEAAEKAGDLVTAAENYQRLVDLGFNGKVRLSLGRVLAKQGLDGPALQALEGVLESQEHWYNADLTEALELAAACAERIGDARKALEYLERACARRGEISNEEYRRLVRAAEKAGDTRRLAYYLEKLVHVEPEGPDRFANKTRLGDMYREVWKDSKTAFAWYLEAAEEGTSPKVALVKALEAAVESAMHQEAAKVLERLIELEQDGYKRARYHYALASHLRDHLRDLDKAKAHLWSALELDADFEEAVKALEGLLEDDFEGWASLLRLIARQHRLARREEKLQETLLRLADLYLSKLNNSTLAAEVLAEACESAPKDVELAVRYADLLTRMPGKEEEALRQHRRVVALEPTRVESYRAIRDLCLLKKDTDGAWCAASALVVLGVASEAENAAFEQGRQPKLMLRRDTLPQEAFERLIVDEATDMMIAQVFALLRTPLLRLLPLKSLVDYGLSEKDRIRMDINAPLQNMAKAVAKVFGIPMPPLYRASGKRGVAKLAVNPPALAIGDDAALEWKGRELRFALSRALITFAPGFELTAITDAASLRLCFLAAVRVAFPDFPVPEDARGVEEMAREIRTMLSEEARGTLLELLTAFRRARRAIDISAFLEGVDRTASRAGLFMSNDLKIAAILLQEDNLYISDLEFGDRVTDLCAYAVSEAYSELRRFMLKL